MHIMEDVVYFPLNISDKFDIIHNKNLKNLLAKIYNNSKYKTMVKV